MDQLIPPEAVAEARDARDVEVWPENWDAVEIFCQCDTQWTVLIGPGAVFHEGLDYQKVASVARDWLGKPLTKNLLTQIRVMEHEAKKLLNR